ncbi:MAG TPA: RNA polymerase sigma factor [Polyangiaceae bacterium]|jgi:RNA polymerase sigma-70 factor (ECF subfamily)
MASTVARWLRPIPGKGQPQKSARADDEALIEAIQRGDPKLGADLYARLIRVVDCTLYRVLGSRDPEHGDLVQSSFEQIVVTIAQRKYARACSLTSWASAITCNVALNTLRSRRTERKYIARGLEQGLLEEVEQGRDLEREVLARREMERVRAELSQMSEERSEVLLLHDMLGKELSEISVLLNISVSAAQSRLVRGRRELEQRLTGRHEVGDD